MDKMVYAQQAVAARISIASANSALGIGVFSDFVTPDRNESSTVVIPLVAICAS